MTITEAMAPGVEAFRPAFRHSTNEPTWLANFRRAGVEQFSATGLPTTKDERWKYTSLRPLARAKYLPVGPKEISAPERMLEGAAQAVFVNGCFSHEASDLSGLDGFVGSFRNMAGDNWIEELLTSTPFSSQAMYSLNSAAFVDGLAVKLGNNDQLSRPLELVFVSMPGNSPGMWHPRVAVDLGCNSAATIVERHISIGGGSYFANHATDIRVRDGGRLVHAKVQQEGTDGRHLSMARVRVAENSFYDSFTLTLGGSLSRSETEVRIEGTGAEVRLNGCYIISGRQHADHTSRIDHLAPGTTSRQVFAGAIDGAARGVFQGHIVVDKAAQQTDGHQMNRALLLSDRAEIDSKPILEIYADDVKCSHGATAGDIDEDHLFYLRARGIPAAAARNLVVRGFLADPIENLSNEYVQAALLAALDSHLGLERL